MLPHPDALTPFAPITYNGPVSGNGGLFLFASFDRTVAGVSIWVLDGNTGQLVPYPASFPANVPFSVAPSNLAMPSDLNQRLLNHGLTRPLVDPCEDDNPQGFRPQQIPGQAPNGRTYHHRRHHLVPRNQDLTSWWVPTRNGEPRLLLSTPIKTTQLPQPNGGVLTIDYLAYPSATAPPFVSTVLSPSPMPPLTMTQVVTYPTALPGFPGTWDHCNVLSDLSPNVRSSFNPSYPTALAWIAGRNRITDVPSPGIAAPPPLLVLADHAAPGTLPSVTVQVLQSPLAPYAERVLVWNDLGGATPLAQHLIVPCRDGVEIYDPAPPGPPGTPPALVKVVAASAGKEICTDVSYFGPSPYDDTPPTPYFIVLERTIGEMQGAGGGVNFLVFDLLPGSGPARGPTWAAGTLPGLSANFGRGPMDVVRGLNDIAVAPPRRDASGGWDPFGLPAATAWFGVWDADTAVTDPPAQLPFGAMVGVENTGLGTYTDSLLGFNAGGTIPGWTNVRYYTPVRDGTGQTFVIPGGIALDGYPVPVGEASTNPIFNLLPGGGLVNQNLVAWYWDNGYEQTDPIAFLGSGYGVAMLDVLATWIATNPAYPGGALVDGTAGGTYASGILDRSQEVITERPLFGYINYPSISTLFAQRQSGIETFVATLLPGLGRNIYAVGRLPQTPPPVAPPGPQWLYQKRRHTAWNPPAEIQPAVNAFGAGLPNTTTGIDTAITIEGTVPVTGQSWYLRDDWVAYFVPWRVNPIFGLAPAVQGQLYWDWSSPLFGQNPLALGLFDATTSPPWNPADGQGTGGLGYPHYPLTGQTPLWANWAQGPWPNPLWPQHNSTVLRSHSNRWPVNLNGFGSLAWVGIGANTMVQYSFGTNSLPSSVGYAFGTAGAPSIIAAHVDQIEAGAGLPPAAAPTPGPGRYRASVLHYQAAQIPGSPPPPALGPYLEATLVNNGSAVDWQFLLPPAEVVSTEILALRPAGL